MYLHFQPTLYLMVKRMAFINKFKNSSKAHLCCIRGISWPCFFLFLKTVQSVMIYSLFIKDMKGFISLLQTDWF